MDSNYKNNNINRNLGNLLKRLIIEIIIITHNFMKIII